MTSKERVLSALNHQQPDKVPMDFGGCTCSCMHVTCVRRCANTMVWKSTRSRSLRYRP